MGTLSSGKKFSPLKMAQGKLFKSHLVYMTDAAEFPTEGIRGGKDLTSSGLKVKCKFLSCG